MHTNPLSGNNPWHHGPPLHFPRNAYLCGSQGLKDIFNRAQGTLFPDVHCSSTFLPHGPQFDTLPLLEGSRPLPRRLPQQSRPGSPIRRLPIQEDAEQNSKQKDSGQIGDSTVHLFFKDWWAGKIDKPSKEMYKLLKKKQAKDLIPLLSKSDGTQAQDQMENMSMILEHFQNIFSSPSTPQPNRKECMQRISWISKKVLPPQSTSQLDSEFLPLETEAVIDALKNHKSPGIDGLPSEFFKNFRDIIIIPLMLIWKESVHFGALPKTINERIIKMIHKKGPKDSLPNWRPLTMLCTAYKIYAKVISNRLSSMLTSWIRREQKGFIKGRYILEAIITLWEGVEFAEETKHDFFFFKIDFEKAYDKLECDFILQSLADMGLNPPFIKMVSTLFGNARAKVCVNGLLIDSFSLKRSIRQGFRLAPLLFAIATDALGWLTEHEMQEGRLKGINLPDGSSQLCLQHFADDTNGLIHNNGVYQKLLELHGYFLCSIRV